MPDHPISIPMPTPLTEIEYRSRTDAILASVEARIDSWLQDDVIDIDSQRTGGLLEMSFPNGSKIILNTQPPLQEMWLAARSGGFHYRFIDGEWRDSKSGQELYAALSSCASEQGAKTLRFDRPQ